VDGKLHFNYRRVGALSKSSSVVTQILYRHPAMYGLKHGKQYIIVAISGGVYSGEYVAYTLPE
jgi:hypothetical protein